MSMRRHNAIRRLGIVVGSSFLLAGTLETIRVLTSGDGGLAFWFGSLFGGGAMVLLGTLGLRSHPLLALVAVTVGALAGSLATAWTLVLPVLALWLVVMRAVSTLGNPAPGPEEPVIRDPTLPGTSI
jgi:hypothetical protein